MSSSIEYYRVHFDLNDSVTSIEVLDFNRTEARIDASWIHGDCVYLVEVEKSGHAVTLMHWREDQVKARAGQHLSNWLSDTGILLMRERAKHPIQGDLAREFPGSQDTKGFEIKGPTGKDW